MDLIAKYRIFDTDFKSVESYPENEAKHNDELKVTIA